MVNQNEESSGTGIDEKYILKLFVTGATPNSIRAISNIKNIVEKYLNKNYELEIVDIFQLPEIASKEQVIAIPMLLKKFPLPEKRLVGDMSDLQKVLKGLGIKEQKNNG